VHDAGERWCKFDNPNGRCEMGEYAKFSGESVKIGTCEEMYYLRLNQRRLVEHEDGNVDVNGPEVYELRFRFPWPDEDAVEPGGFQQYERAVDVGDYQPPEGVNHSPMRNGVGYEDCPKPSVLLTQVKLLTDGRAVPVLMCGGCKAKWREEDPEQIAFIAQCLRDEGERLEKQEFYDEVAGRLLLGAGLIEVTDQTETTRQKHTPGPWGLLTGTISSASGDEIAEVVGGDGARYLDDEVNAECLANAVLIKAAPELLEELQMLSAIVRLECHNTHPNLLRQVERAEAVIVKATGQKQPVDIRSWDAHFAAMDGE
jgi:hypothetical protein